MKRSCKGRCYCRGFNFSACSPCDRAQLDNICCFKQNASQSHCTHTHATLNCVSYTPSSLLLCARVNNHCCKILNHWPSGVLTNTPKCSNRVRFTKTNVLFILIPVIHLNKWPQVAISKRVVRQIISGQAGVRFYAGTG